MRKIFAVAALLAAGTAAVAQSGGYSSGAVSVSATPNSSSHAAGSSVGGLFTVPIARGPGGSGILNSVFWKSTGSALTGLLVRIWQRSPVNTTCTDQSAFVGSDADDVYLIASPFAMTPISPINTTGDAASYAAVSGLSINYKNQDNPIVGGNNTALSQNLYVCVVTAATDTADESKTVRLTLSGPQN